MELQPFNTRPPEYPNGFPPFWYESQPVWGWVHTLDDLLLVYQYQKHMGGLGITNAYKFLAKSKAAYKGYRLEFGTRREHGGFYSLADFLNQYDQYNRFVKMAENTPEQ